MNYIVTTTESEAEDIQKYIFYTLFVEPRYVEFVPSKMSAEDLRNQRGASKDFAECTISEVWSNGYNNLRGYYKGKIREDDKGVTTDWAIPRETVDNKWAVQKPTGEIDLSSFTFQEVEDTGNLFPVLP